MFSILIHFKRKEPNMAHSVFAIFILLTVFGVSAVALPPTLTFDCTDGMITSINVDNKNSLLVETGQNKQLCHFTDDHCNWKNKQKLRVVYDQDEPNKDSKVVAGQLYHYDLECTVGYLAQVSVAAFNINSITTKAYELKTEKETIPIDALTIRIAMKGENSALTKTVFVGDPLVLRITGKASHSLKPVNCTAFKPGSTANKYMLWDNTGCTTSDAAIMSDNWKTIDDHTIEIDMFAFRFVDSLSVMIECSAYVCPISATTCGESINDCLTTTTIKPEDPTQAPSQSVTTPKSKRRRRSGTQNYFKKNTASTSFTVVDRDGDSSGCEGLSLNITLCFTTFIAYLFVIGRN